MSDRDMGSGYQDDRWSYFDQYDPVYDDDIVPVRWKDKAPVWRTALGETIPIRSMTDAHLRNAINLLKEQGRRHVALDAEAKRRKLDPTAGPLNAGKKPRLRFCPKCGIVTMGSTQAPCRGIIMNAPHPECTTLWVSGKGRKP